MFNTKMTIYAIVENDTLMTHKYFFLSFFLISDKSNFYSCLIPFT